MAEKLVVHHVERALGVSGPQAFPARHHASKTQVVGRQEPVDERRVEGRLVPGDGLPAELLADAAVALEGAKLTRYSTLALPRALHRADYEMGILGIGIAALISVDIDVLGHCPPPSGSRRFFAEEKYSSRLRPALLRPARHIVHHRMPLRVNRMVIAVGDLIDPRAIAIPLELLGSRLPISQGAANRIDCDPRSSARASPPSVRETAFPAPSTTSGTPSPS